MNQPDTMLNQLMNWVETTRAHSAHLHLEADGYLARLTQLRHRQQQIDTLNHAPLTLGLYGGCVEGKHHLLKMIAADGRDEIYVQLGAKTLNYLTHINPDNAPTSIAVRFTDLPPTVAEEHHPLLLTLFNESELAQRLIRQYQAGQAPRRVQNSVIAAILNELQMCRQAEPSTSMTGEQFSALTHSYQQCVRSPYQLDDALLHQMAELAPWLNLSDRAVLLSILWGEDTTLTALWQQQAQTLHHLGNVSQLLAPASLVVDGFLLPGKGFLFPASPQHTEQNTDIIVCPLHHGKSQARQSIAQHELTQVCAEITFTLSRQSSLPGVDLLDIPDHQLNYYQDNLQPDTLLICHSQADNQHPTPIAKHLVRWVEQTQIPQHSKLPRLVWAITPFDIRFTQGGAADDTVQRFVTQSGKRWGTLQAVDNRNRASLQEWLAAVLSESNRQQRLTTLQDALIAQVLTQFGAIAPDRESRAHTSRQQTETLIRTLQSKATQHGELIDNLMLPRDTLQQCWLQYHQTIINKPAELMLNIDLFADVTPTIPAVFPPSDFASQVYALWLNHLRQLVYRQTVAPSLGLETAQLQTLCDILITTSYRLELLATLKDELAQNADDAAMAVTRAANVISDFVSWLGYHQVAIAERPLSRIDKESVIFSPPPQASANTRLTHLGEQPTHGNARYIYDWLVALLNRASENTHHISVDDIGDASRETLHAILLSGNKSPAA
ncbi:virulence factor SrfC family protein [Yersinia proxima]|uniref:Virulence factor SrfC family protein n=1 Tax=Yersinia proxima TaxID=2890316 RepID=A0ABW9F1I9_9GAMM